MTLFNARVDPATGDMAHVATVIRGVHWYGGPGATADPRGGRAARPRAVVRLPVSADAGGRRWVDPDTYRRAADVTGLYTLACGDLIRRGAAQSPDGACLALSRIVDDTGAPRAPHWKLIAE